MTNLSQPRVTIVVTERERHSLALRVIEGIVAHTPRPYRFFYLDTQSPPWLMEELDRRATAWGLEVIGFDQPLWPQEARHRIAPLIDTEYVVFIDNDIEVEAGWLEHMIACADETGAGAVGPLYLWGDGVARPKIHMAGGTLTEAITPEGRVLAEAHCLVNQYPDQVGDQLVRGPTDFAEYHCMLLRTELLSDGRLMDPSMRCVHEHIDTALTVRQRGHSVLFEPSARVNYLAFVDYLLDDLPMFRWRWHKAEGEASIAAFCRKWNVVNDDRSFGGVRQFLNNNSTRIDPIRPSQRDRPELTTVMRREELCQTRSELLDCAQLAGYDSTELTLLANAYHVAHVIMDGGYRPCGRPFINHLVGTASVLVRYGFRAETVAAGLLHSAYSHCPPHAEGTQAALQAVCAELGGVGSVLERRVRAYTLRAPLVNPRLATSPALPRLTLLEAEALAIAAANEVDMHLSGEFRYSGRGDALSAEAMHQIEQVCLVLGTSGLYQTLATIAGAEGAPLPQFLTRIPASYRISGDKHNAILMTTLAASAVSTWLPDASQLPRAAPT